MPGKIWINKLIIFNHPLIPMPTRTQIIEKRKIHVNIENGKYKKKNPKMVIKGSEEPQMLQIWIHVTDNTEKLLISQCRKHPNARMHQYKESKDPRWHTIESHQKKNKNRS